MADRHRPCETVRWLRNSRVAKSPCRQRRHGPRDGYASHGGRGGIVRLSCEKSTSREFSPLIPLGRMGSTAETAAMVAYLVGPESCFVTGATMTIDGGNVA